MPDSTPFDDTPVEALVPVGLAATATMLDPTGGMLTALGAHVLTNISSDSAWRGATQDIWADLIIENDEERRRQYNETKTEFHRHRLLIDWLSEALAQLAGRVDHLEVVALNMLAQSEAVLRARPDPEMRKYLRNAWSNALYRPGKFTQSWVRRLNHLLAKMGIDHVEMLLQFIDIANPPVRTGARVIKLSEVERDEILQTARGVVYRELVELGIVERHGDMFVLSLHGVLLADYVSESGTAEKRPPIL